MRRELGQPVERFASRSGIAPAIGSSSCRLLRSAAPASAPSDSAARPACRRGPRRARDRIGSSAGQQASTQSQQMAREVSAVDRRDVPRQQRLQRPRVVPVVEVTPVPLERLHACERAWPCARAVGRPSGSRSRRRPGWRATPGPCWSATCDARRSATGCSWIVVRRQPVVLRSDEGLEVRPRPPRQRAEKTSGSASDAARAARSGRLSHHAMAGDEQPEHAGSVPPHASAVGARQRQYAPMAQRSDRAPPTSTEYDARPDRRAIPATSPDGRPFEQSRCARRACARSCAAIASAAEERLVRQAGERKQPGRTACPPSAARAARCCRSRHVRRLAAQICSTRPSNGGSETMPSDDEGPAATAMAETAMPSSNSSSSATGTRLRRRLSRSSTATARRADCVTAVPRHRHARQQPARDLPVAADPAVPAADVGAVARGIVLVHLDVAEQPRARVAPFEEIVAEDPVLGKAAVSACSNASTS